MTANVDLNPYGSHPPDRLARSVLARNRSLPANWLGLRMSMPLRRIVIDWLGDRPVDTTLWNARVRLYPSRNSCEKNALFTPQMLDVIERGALAAAIDRRLTEGKTFTFVDIGANVGLYSLFVAERGGAQARILAAEPQPGIVDRLLFNLRANAGFEVRVVAIAVADREGGSDWSSTIATAAARVSTRARKPAAPRPSACNAGRSPRSCRRPEFGDRCPQDRHRRRRGRARAIRAAAPELLPRLLLIEDRPSDWAVDLYALFRQRGYAVAARSRHNVVWRLP
jgi:hypothetical protein